MTADTRPETSPAMAGSRGADAGQGPQTGRSDPEQPSHWSGGLRLALRSHPALVDTGLALLVFLPAASALVFRPYPAHVQPWAWAATVVAAGALLLRRRHPWLVLVLTAVGCLVTQFFSADVPPLIFAVVAALATVTLTGRRWSATVAAVIIAGAALLVGSLRDEAFWAEPRPLAMASLCALAVAIADATRYRRAYVAAVEERARRAEQTREEEARRRVADERLRIARDLHDVLAHHIAVINVQAGVAQHLSSSRPDESNRALGHVREAARSVLAEMQAVLTVLRAGDEPDPTGSLAAEPAPGLHRVASLVRQFGEAGMVVEVVGGNTGPALPAAVDLVAFRVIQEGLTNARKHAGSTATVVEIDVAADCVRLSITNAPPVDAAARSAHSAGGGFGLLGMRERVASVAGAMDAGPTADGGFRVSASIPLHSASR